MQNQEKLEKLARLVEAKTKVVNISGIKDFDAIWQKHILDSLQIENTKTWGEIIKAPKNLQILDLGTGGGFPGLPLAINYPHIKFSLIDGTGKKIDAVNEFIRTLGINNAQGLWVRSEDLAQNKLYKNNFDVVISRAVAYLPILIEMTKDLVAPDGILVFYKTFNEQEIKEGAEKASILGFKIEEIYKYKLENDELQRCLVFLKRI